MTDAPTPAPDGQPGAAAAEAVQDQARAVKEGRGALVWSTLAIATATLTLAAFNAESARSWSDGLKPSALSLRVQDVCHAWADATAGVGLSAPRFAIRRVWRQGLAARWPGQPPSKVDP